MIKMGRSSVNEVSTSGRTNEADSKREGGLEQFLGFPGQLVSYPPGFGAFREFCKAKVDIGGVKSTMDRKDSLLGEVAEEGNELELLLGKLSLSGKKRVKSKSKKVAKAQSARSMTGVDEGTGQISEDEVRAKTPGRVGSRITWGCGWLDGVSPQIVLDNQGDDVELPEDGSEKVVKEMSLRINHLESGLARELETSKALLSVQAELQVELDASRTCEDHALMCNQEFVEYFDRMKEVNENSEHRFVKVYFRLEKLNQVIYDLTRQVEEKDYGIKKGLVDLSEATKSAENLQCQVDVLAVKGKQAVMAQYCIQVLERTEELCRSDLNNCRTKLEKMRRKYIGKDDRLRVARERTYRRWRL
ncbi:hypothetical protein GIB67_023759 [Kingdonia uniflora]|uniref:Uncharacterized protein n=1 Tax=Kingdonia uniflora TaxID=39325 RepID=A0A7J7LG16_9MAGN|nr:hypothetical protein GIB67_023759 [Kingdonia uniflora]